MIALTMRPATIRIATAAVAFVVIAGLVAAVTYDRGVPIGDARLHTEGVANVLSPDGRLRVVRGTVGLHTGDIVEAVQGGMTIDLPDGSTVEGRPAVVAQETQNTRVRIARPVELLAGDLLLIASKGAEVDAGGNLVSLERAADGINAARLSRALVVVAAVYRGQLTLDSAGQNRTITSLRQLEVTALGRPSSDLRPIDVHDSDPWDRRFLGEAMDLTATLNSIATSYAPSLARGQGRTVAFYRNLLPALSQQTEFTPELVTGARAADPGNTLIGAAIATLGRRGSFTQRWNDTFAFHDQGAGWGLVALDQGVASDPLLQTVRAALDQSPLQFAAATTPTTTVTRIPAGGGTVPSGGSTPTTNPTSPTAPPTTSPPPAPTLPPITTPPVPPTGSPLVDGLVNDVNELLNGLLGLAAN